MKKFQGADELQQQLCKCCDGLSIDVLVKLAEAEFLSDTFPQESYYRHQPSYDELLKSANDGCRLCRLICSGFQDFQIPDCFWEGSTREEAIRSIEEEGEESNIKMAIGAEHLYGQRELKDVKLFDVIMIQAGRPDSAGVDSDDPEYHEGIPPLHLVLSVARGQQKHVRGYRVGRHELVPDLGTDENYSISKGWLMDCFDSHEICPSKTSSILPTRVLDVGRFSNPQGLRLFLTAGIEGSYVALSHCWGGPISPLLVTETIDLFQEGLEYDSLPANFRDAISVTRGLGFQYLWIDSLCIIQDSAIDWEIESKRMGSIYRDAAVTISASTSCRSTDGFLSRLQPEVEKDIAIFIRIFEGDNAFNFVKAALKREYEEDLDHLFSKSPLNTRGWTLQETVLSPRILHYGTQKIYWQCPQGFQSADGIPPGPGSKMPQDQSYSEISYSLYPKTSVEHLSRPPNQDLILEEYYVLVTEYSSRSLSFKSDKLPAMAGLATLIHPFLKGDYLAGIWSADFGQGLLWFKEMRTCEHVHDRAPSWSWAITDEPILFSIASNMPQRSKYDAQLVDHKIVPRRKENPYGQVASCHLIIKGLTKEFVRSSQEINNASPESAVARAYFDEAEEGGSIEGFSSVFTVTGETENYLLCMIDGKGQENTDDLVINHSRFSDRVYLVLLIKVDRNYDGNRAEYYTALCLILVKAIDDGNVYNRAGFLVSNGTWPAKFRAWLDAWETQTITIS